MATQKRAATCYCKAYAFPHRFKSGKCKRRKPLKRTRKVYAAMSRRNKKARA